MATHREKSIDRHLGDKIRRRRTEVGMTQEQLAEALDVSYQQIQKYETGANRISASRIYELARCLGAPIEALFEGIDADREASALAEGDELSAPRQRATIEFVRALGRLEDGGVQNALTGLLRAVADREERHRRAEPPPFER